MTTITSGAIALEKPMFCARSTRNASEKRASVSTAAMLTTMVKLRPSLPASDQRMFGLRAFSMGGRSGSSTPTTMSTTASIAGTTAIQNTVWKLLAKYHIAASASSGPPIPPTVSSAWRRPKLRPRAAGGVMSAINASRGAPRMPLPSRSAKRAPMIQPSVGASGNANLESAAMP